MTYFLARLYGNLDLHAVGRGVGWLGGTSQIKKKVLPFSKCKYGNLLKDQIFVLSRKRSKSISEKRQKNKISGKNKKIPTEFVKLDHFLKINCDYLKPNKLNDSFLEINSGLSVFHTNVRSLPRHFDEIDEVFGNCKTLPDVLALSDTMILDRTIPEKDGYVCL